MRMNQYTWIDPKIKWNLFIKRKLCRENYLKQHAFLVCTSPQEKLLFEIIETKWLSSFYQQETVLAICSSRAQAFEQVQKLVDELYNTKIYTLEQLLK